VLLEVGDLLQIWIVFDEIFSGVASQTASHVGVFEQFYAAACTALCTDVLQRVPQRVSFLEVADVARVVATLVHLYKVEILEPVCSVVKDLQLDDKKKDEDYKS